MCLESICARIDLLTKTPFRRIRLIEVKNGPGARLTANQMAVYPSILATGRAYLPHGLAHGGSTVQLEPARYEIQRFPS